MWKISSQDQHYATCLRATCAKMKNGSAENRKTANDNIPYNAPLKNGLSDGSVDNHFFLKREMMAKLTHTTMLIYTVNRTCIVLFTLQTCIFQERLS